MMVVVIIAETFRNMEGMCKDFRVIKRLVHIVGNFRQMILFFISSLNKIIRQSFAEITVTNIYKV